MLRRVGRLLAVREADFSTSPNHHPVSAALPGACSLLLNGSYAKCKKCPVQAWEAGHSLPCLSLLGSKFQSVQTVFG